MNWKNIVVTLCSVLILVAIGLGVAIVYSDYLYSPTGSLDTLQVMGNGEPGFGRISAADAQLLRDVEAWAKEEGATVLFKNGLSAGCGFCGYSDWAERELGLDGAQSGEGGVYVSDDPAIQAAYVSGDVFLPKSAGLEIRGTYRSGTLPPVLSDSDFLYPLGISASVDGIYFTDARDLEKLEALFEAGGYSVIATRQTNTLTWKQLARRLVSDSFLSRAVLCAMAGLIFCFVYSVLMLYQDNTRRLWVRHLFGLSRRRILVGMLLLAAGMVLASALLFGALLVNGLTYLGAADLRRIFGGVLALDGILALSVSCAGYLRLSRQFRLRGA